MVSFSSLRDRCVVSQYYLQDFQELCYKTMQISFSKSGNYLVYSAFHLHKEEYFYISKHLKDLDQ